MYDGATAVFSELAERTALKKRRLREQVSSIQNIKTQTIFGMQQ